MESVDDWVAVIKTDYRQAALSARERAMLDFVVKLTATPGAMVQQDVERLREVEFDDTSIHDIVQATALFNYFNRLADGLGIDGEPNWSSVQTSIPNQGAPATPDTTSGE